MVINYQHYNFGTIIILFSIIIIIVAPFTFWDFPR